MRRLPVGGQRVCVAISQALMLYATWLVTEGSWVQSVVNWEVVAPASGLSNAVLYGAGVVFGVSTMPILAVSLFRTVTGIATADELVIVRESEEPTSVEELMPISGQADDKGTAGGAR